LGASSGCFARALSQRSSAPPAWPRGLFQHQRAAVVVYQRGSHVINVFSWDGYQGDKLKME
jgi:hypothetical protein